MNKFPLPRLRACLIATCLIGIAVPSAQAHDYDDYYERPHHHGWHRHYWAPPPPPYVIAPPAYVPPPVYLQPPSITIGIPPIFPGIGFFPEPRHWHGERREWHH